MNRAFVVALGMAVMGAPGVARAQQAATGETLLHLSVDGSVRVAPDQLVAELLAQATSASAAEAQRRVNALIGQGMQAAHAVAGIEARAVGYQVSPADEKRTQWTAQQTLEVRGGDGPALLDLANRLQQLGFVTASLDWQLSAGVATQGVWRRDDGGVEGVAGGGGLGGGDAGIACGSPEGRAAAAAGWAGVPAGDGDGEAERARAARDGLAGGRDGSGLGGGGAAALNPGGKENHRRSPWRLA